MAGRYATALFELALEANAVDTVRADLARFDALAAENAELKSTVEREVNSLRRIRSRWVAEIVDADPWAPVPFVATRYVPGLSLHDHVVEEGPIEGRNLIWFAGCLAEGLASTYQWFLEQQGASR